MYKYAGKQVDMIEHFTNTAVYAFVIGDIIEMAVKTFHWNQNVILFLNRGVLYSHNANGNLEKNFDGKKRFIQN